MDRRHLHYFVAVIDYDGFTPAAKALYIAQPSLSQAIKTLESELGVQLFYRLAQGVRLTPAGEALEGPARRALRGLEAARSAVISVADLQSGLLDVACIRGMAADPLPHLIAGFHARYPRVEIRILDPGERDILDLVRSGSSEVALTVAPENDVGLCVNTFEEQELFLALPPGSAEPPGATVPAKRIEDVPLITVTQTKALLRRILHDIGVTPRFGIETAHREAVLPLVCAGVGGAILSPALAKDAAMRGAVVCHLEPRPTRNVVVVHRNADLTPAAKAFLELLELPRPGPWSPDASPRSPEAARLDPALD
jgi:DNA-binding transcriptional LysR family regulator